MRVALLGKKYKDKIYHIKNLRKGETNVSNYYVERLGGAYNFLDKESENNNLLFEPFLRGEKIATIINDKEKSTRTSFTYEIEKSIITDEDIDKINSDYDWLHVCYVDDIGPLQSLQKVNIPISLDFCTLTPRSRFVNIIMRSEFVFDSRERFSLYDTLKFKNPLILHDPHGVDVRSMGAVKHSVTMVPIQGLSVNGAGDLFAKNFIKNFIKHGIIKSSTMAMEETTGQLLRRKH